MKYLLLMMGAMASLGCSSDVTTFAGSGGSGTAGTGHGGAAGQGQGGGGSGGAPAGGNGGEPSVGGSGGAPGCAPNSQAPCYSGPPGTAGVGLCHEGSKTCNAAGTDYGPCNGEVTPVAETCNTPADDDCSGQANEGGAGCVCPPNTSASCYDGPAATLGVGICAAGSHTCNGQGTAWGPCNGETLPAPDLCATVADENCDGSSTPCVVAGTWSRDFGTPSDEEPVGIAYDPGTGISAVASRSGMVVVLDSSGTTLWTKQISAPISALAFAPNGDLVVGGVLQSFVDLGGAVLISAGWNDAFIVRYGAGGQYLSSHGYGGSGSEVLGALAIDTAGNIVMAGQFGVSADFGGATLVDQGSGDYFVAKVDASGNHLWSKGFGDASNAQQVIRLGLDPGGAVILTGSLWGSVSFGGAPLVAQGNGDAFAVMLAPDGSHVWSKVYGDSTEQDGYGIGADASGNVLLVGAFHGAIDFGNGALLAGPSDYDVFVAKLAAADGTAIWSRRYGDAYNQVGLGVMADTAGNVFFTGSYSGAPDFGGGPFPALPNGGASFLVKLDPSGGFLAARHFGDGNSQVGLAVANDPSGYVIQAGANHGTVDFGHGPLTTQGGYDMTVARLSL
ncbi:MAG: hypothetical protein HY908_13570 [Myxococcales bacterium]|nr:hypothetical protein [Myxococcales bacterium]